MNKQLIPIDIQENKHTCPVQFNTPNLLKLGGRVYHYREVPVLQNQVLYKLLPHRLA